MEQVAVDVGKSGQVLIEGCRTPFLRCVENLKQFGQSRPGIRTALAGPRVDDFEEDVARLEHPGVVSEHAAQDHPHEEPFQIVSPVARIRERVVQPSDQLGGLDVRRILVAEGPALHAENEAEHLDMRGQVDQREGDGLPLVQIVKLEGLEGSDKDEARARLGRASKYSPA